MAGRARKILSLEKAWEALARALPAAGRETVELDRAEGRFLADAARASQPWPPEPRMRWDGYALPEGPLPPLPAVFPIAGYGTPAHPFGHPVPDGAVARLDRGAPVPPRAGAFARIEETCLVGTERVRIEATAADAVEPAGARIEGGREILPRGARLGPVRLSLLEAAGGAAADCLVLPRVTIVPIGDDLSEGPGGGPAIRDLVSPALARRLAGCGFEVRQASPVRDDEEPIRLALLRAAERGIAIAAGGLGSGFRDRTARSVRGLRARPIAAGIALDPGGSTVLEAGPSGALIALPGDPYEAAIAFEGVVWPAIVRAYGLDLVSLGGEGPAAIVLGARSTDRAQILPVRGTPGAESAERLPPTLSSLGCCDGLALIPAGAPETPAGARGRVFPPPV